MSKIFRKKRETPFVQIDKRPLNEKELSWRAKGILAYLMALPDDWQIYLSDLKNRSKDGRDATATGLKELIKAKYIVKIQRRESGKFSQNDYLVSDEKLSNEMIRKWMEEKKFATVDWESVDGKSVNEESVDGKSDATNNSFTNNSSNDNTSKEDSKVETLHTPINPNSKIDSKENSNQHIPINTPPSIPPPIATTPPTKSVAVSFEDVLELFNEVSERKCWDVPTNRNSVRKILKYCQNDLELLRGIIEVQKLNTVGTALRFRNLKNLAVQGNWDRYFESYMRCKESDEEKKRLEIQAKIEENKLEYLTQKITGEEKPQPQINDENFNECLTLFEKHISKKTDIALAYAEYQKYKAEMIAKKPESYNFERVFKISVDVYTKNVREGFYSEEFTPAFHNWIIKRTWLNPPTL